LFKSPAHGGISASLQQEAKILTAGIYGLFRGLKFEPDAEIGQNISFLDGHCYETGHVKPYLNILLTSYYAL